MEERKIVLYFNDIPISTLSFVDNKYIHKYNYVNLKKAIQNGCPTIIIGSKDGVLDRLPSIFYDFEISPGRTKLRQELGITKEDNIFDQLYKRALQCDDFSKKGFWIGVDK